MSTIILNGSPKGASEKSNTNILSNQFISRMKDPCEIKCIAKANPKELANYIKDYDNIIIMLPLYIHAMPSIVMKFIEYLDQARAGQSLGFIIQAGFIETAQEKYVKRYFEDLAMRLKYCYLGTVCKGEAAGIYMFPKMFKKVLALFAELGEKYEQTGRFDKDIVAKLGTPYELSKRQATIFELANKTGLNNIGWHRELKKNGTLHLRLDKPFL